MAIVGYARVSTEGQNLSGQLAALKAAGAHTIYREKVSGVRANRPQLTKLVAGLGTGDVVVVTKLDRLGRSTRELLDLIDRISKAGASLRSPGRSAMGHREFARPPAVDDVGRHSRVRAGADPRTHRRGTEACNGCRRQVWPQAQAVRLSTPGSRQAPSSRRDLGLDRQELCGRYLDDFAALTPRREPSDNARSAGRRRHGRARPDHSDQNRDKILHAYRARHAAPTRQGDFYRG